MVRSYLNWPDGQECSGTGAGGDGVRSPGPRRSIGSRLIPGGPRCRCRRSPHVCRPHRAGRDEPDTRKPGAHRRCPRCGPGRPRARDGSIERVSPASPAGSTRHQQLPLERRWPIDSNSSTPLGVSSQVHVGRPPPATSFWLRSVERWRRMVTGARAVSAESWRTVAPSTAAPRAARTRKAPALRAGLSAEIRWRSSVAASTPARVTNGCGPTRNVSIRPMAIQRRTVSSWTPMRAAASGTVMRSAASTSVAERTDARCSPAGLGLLSMDCRTPPIY